MKDFFLKLFLAMLVVGSLAGCATAPMQDRGSPTGAFDIDQSQGGD